MTSLNSTVSDELKTFVKDFLKTDLKSNVESENDAIEKSNTVDVLNDMRTLIKLKKSMNVVSILIAITITYVVTQTKMNFLNHSFL